jgi:hypothetical protein
LFKEQYKRIEIPGKKYDRMQQAMGVMDTGFLSADDFINRHIRILLEKRAAWAKEREDYKEN